MRKLWLLILAIAASALFATAAAPASANSITASCNGSPCSTDWYDTAVDLSWNVTPTPDTSDGCDEVTVGETDADGVDHTCSATWSEGDAVDPVTVTLKVDLTDPSVDGANADRPADSNGWFNHTVTFDFFGSDDLSGIGPCSQNLSYSGPDSANASIPGTCHDVAGNSATASHTFKYDHTPPTVTGAQFGRDPDSNGWFNHPVGYTFTGTDATSGIDSSSCTSGTYSGEDGNPVTVSGGCDDNAGNHDDGTQTLKYDSAPPTVTGANLARAPDSNGWFNHPVAYTFKGTDTLSGIDASSCTSGTYSGASGAPVTVNGSCDDNAGNSDSGSQTFDYDATKPTTTTGTPDRDPNANGWYKAAVSFDFAGNDDQSGIASCQSGVTYNGVDSATASVGGHCTDNAGNVGDDLVKTFKFDKTKPTVSGANPDHAANANGWFNSPVTFTFTGTDNLSGVDSSTCSKPTYTTGDSATASVSGTCADLAGNVSNSAPHTFKFDATPPVTKAPTTSGGVANAAGWYRSPVTFSFGGTDNLSGINTCPTVQYSGPDDDPASVSGACTDKAGNTGNTVVQGLKYDSAPPTINSATPARSPDSEDWYNHSIGWTFGGTDATSQIDAASCQTKTYTGPASATATVAGHCSDNAGNVGADFTSPAFKFDNVAPPAPTATPDRPADSGTSGWYRAPVTWTFASTDALSGTASCDAVTYSTPQSATASVSGKCTDHAGNASTTTQKTFKYDSVKPTVSGATPDHAANANGWFNSPVTFHFTGTDATSGVAQCDTAAPYSTPDNATASVSGTCTDNAGNVSDAAPHAFKYDATAPDTTGASLARSPDHGGWYNHPVSINLTGTDNLSNFAGGSTTACGRVTYSGPAGSGVHGSGACADQAGNKDATPVASPTFDYDATAPVVSGAVANRPPDRNGWYNHPVSFTFQGADNVSGVATCSSGVTYAGPDRLGAKVGGTCTDHAGNAAGGTATLLYDHTPPSVLGALPDRLPDHDGWFNHPVRLRFLGSDATSGVAGCSDYVYSGPPNGRTLVSGSCVDGAGNGGAASFPMKYDATPPAAAVVTTTPQNGKALITWTKPADAVAVKVLRSGQGKASARQAVYSGTGTQVIDKHLRNGRNYVYTVTVSDAAGNNTSTTASVKPTSLSLRPLPGAVVGSPPKLTWKKVRHAHYYNLQLFAGNAKVLSIWPKVNRYQVKQAWLYNGRPFSLVPGVQYRWYVWPGVGPRSKNRYGHMLGKSTFTLAG
jgi:hypothetical protein